MKRGLLTKLFLSSVLLFFSASSFESDIPLKFKNFENYKIESTSKNSVSKFFIYGAIKIQLYFEYYHFNDKGDVLEIYWPSRYENPIIYGFDLNNNKRFEQEELIKDTETDGLNGNEEFFTKWEYDFKKYVKDY